MAFSVSGIRESNSAAVGDVDSTREGKSNIVDVKFVITCVMFACVQQLPVFSVNF